MSRKKTDKFFINAPNRRGSSKGHRLMGVNYLYNGDAANLSLQDLLEFLQEQNIDPAKVSLDSRYMALVKP